MLTTSCAPVHLQESSMPDTSELFTNVYKKGFGVEVSCQKKRIMLAVCITPYLHLQHEIFVPSKLEQAMTPNFHFSA
jgi:hypothetical protein